MGPIVISQLATGISVLAGAAIIKSVMDQTQLPMSTGGLFTSRQRQPRCPTCNGTGRITCLCSRWSDGDVGCRTCSGSGRMICNSCGGSGSGRALVSRVHVRPTSRPSSS